MFPLKQVLKSLLRPTACEKKADLLERLWACGPALGTDGRGAWAAAILALRKASVQF